MRIADFPEITTYDESCYMPLDIAGATFKTKVDNITPDIANNVSTTTEGYVWAARQGKLLKDKIDENTQGIAESNGVITQGIVVDSDPWILYQSRDNNTDTLYYPRTAKEILISVEYSGFVHNSVCIPGTFNVNVNLYVAGWRANLLSKNIYIPISFITRAIGKVEVDGSTSNSSKTKVYYR